jgi:hypothetical protein
MISKSVSPTTCQCEARRIDPGSLFEPHSTQNRAKEARAVLFEACKMFDEGFDMTDRVAARTLREKVESCIALGPISRGERAGFCAAALPGGEPRRKGRHRGAAVERCSALNPSGPDPYGHAD